MIWGRFLEDFSRMWLIPYNEQFQVYAIAVEISSPQCSKLQKSGDFQPELKTPTVFNFVKGWGIHFCMPRVPTLLSEVVARPWNRLRLFMLGIINSVRALKAHYFRRKEKNKGLFIWSRVPETTLPPSYPGRANFSLISFKNSTNRLHENRDSLVFRFSD